MKRVALRLVSIASLFWVAGCADPNEQITGQELGDKFRRGVTGHGQLGPIDRSDDPSLAHGVPETHP
jgi:hypothetical protein